MSNQEAEKAFKQPLSDNDISRLLRRPDYQRSEVEAVIHVKVKNGGLPKDESLEPNFEHSSYRVKLFDHSLESSPWAEVSTNKSSHIRES
ncbi:hypothetical protein BGAL_0158g00170 [Botrytis galanthina]|uniref:Uncharacterized protein n=1 Tax=Botrytis galanthina TaxID=278940 RepID=A0A4S8QY22_9HELO|nr:hypothetical protein BGAL_0158g00170 [Botrytis galanthina]